LQVIVSDLSIQGYIQALIQADALFDAADVTKGDFLVLDRGSAPYAVVLPGRIVSAERSGDWGQVTVVWEHSVEVFEDFDGSDYGDFTSARQAVLDAVGENPTLGGNAEISKAHVSDGTEPRYLYSEDGGDVPVFVFSRVTVRCVEEVSYAGSGEFA
jgi:hypothetical protein